MTFILELFAFFLQVCGTSPDASSKADPAKCIAERWFMSGGQPNKTEIIVKLSPGAVSSETPAYAEVKACASQAGVTLEPLHPAVSDAELASYFRTETTSAAASGLIEKLLRCPGVEGAYAKPRGEPPERSTQNASKPE